MSVENGRKCKRIGANGPIGFRERTVAREVKDPGVEPSGTTAYIMTFQHSGARQYSKIPSYSKTLALSSADDNKFMPAQSENNGIPFDTTASVDGGVSILRLQALYSRISQCIAHLQAGAPRVS